MTEQPIDKQDLKETPVGDSLNPTQMTASELLKSVADSGADGVNLLAQALVKAAFGGKYKASDGTTVTLTIDETDNSIDLTAAGTKIKDEVLKEVPTAVNGAISAGTVSTTNTITDPTLKSKIEKLAGVK